MTAYPIAEVASLIGEPSRAAILLALLDGRALPAGELARAARLSAAATSLHLAKLTGGGLLAVRQEGRHRYYRLASAEAAHALEALGAIATAPPQRSLTAAQARVRAARSCYDHLAGVLGVALADLLERQDLLRAEGDDRYAITRPGSRWFADVLGIETAALARGPRPVARRCLDWTERRPHVAGALGAAMLESLMAKRWLARVPASRAVRITTGGQERLAGLGLAGAVAASFTTASPSSSR
jgi:DNA-binding transcriptional ArsR family regulator